jgi:D-glycero-alpha-D-manno-heptose-7-phosphate kinase
MQLAQDSIHIEQHVLGEIVGSQDQVLAAFGGLKYVLFRTDGTFTVDPLPLAAERIAELQRHLMLFYTGIARTASDVAKSYADSLARHRRRLELIRETVEESVDILVSGRDLTEFGALLHEGWRIKRGLSPLVSNPQVDALYDRARKAGAVGGKLTGAGGGGFLLLFVAPDQQPAVLDELAELLHVPFAFESAGSEIVFNEPGIDYEQAEHARRGRPALTFRELPMAV